MQASQTYLNSLDTIQYNKTHFPFTSVQDLAFPNALMWPLLCKRYTKHKGHVQMFTDTQVA